jgi:hypothetical protein
MMEQILAHAIPSTRVLERLFVPWNIVGLHYGGLFAPHCTHLHPSLPTIALEWRIRDC